MESEDERAEELESVAAIFPELSVSDSNPHKVSLAIPVAPTHPLAVTFSPPAAIGIPPDSTSDGELIQPPTTRLQPYDLSHLPPLILEVILPPGYPADIPASFALSTFPAWIPLDVLHTLQKQGHELWEEYGRGQVVFAYIDYLQQAVERAFDLGLDGKPLELPLELKIPLLDWNKKSKREKFEKETFDCGVCLEPKKGSSCYQIARCGHVFCVQCLQDFYTASITEGDVASIKCLTPDCGKNTAQGRKKTKATLTPSELLEIPLERVLVQRYVDIKRKKRIEADKDTIYCPRSWCQGPARSAKYPKHSNLADYIEIDGSDSELETDQAKPADSNDTISAENAAHEARRNFKGDRIAVCENCAYAFCRVCLSGWHGDYIACWPRAAKELSGEEKASIDFIRQHTTPCPSCNSPTQKSHGCNHMSCFMCQTHFCYLCSAWLIPDNPYAHFNKQGTPCYMRLHDLNQGDAGEGGVPFLGARGWEVADVEAAEAQAAELDAIAIRHRLQMLGRNPGRHQHQQQQRQHT